MEMIVSPRVLACCALLLPLLGCGTQDGGGGVIGARLRACGLATPGELREIPFYAPDACYESCLAAASCGDLQAALCGDGVDALIRCDHRCAFECDSGGYVGQDQVCDGFDDCEDGSDEEGCHLPTCDGHPLRSFDICDGYRDCADGSDEEGCPTHEFVCADGTVEPEWVRCDGRNQCVDGSDEEGCPEYGCTGDLEPRPSWRCNGYEQCPDGRDEEGCAELTPRCSTE